MGSSSVVLNWLQLTHGDRSQLRLAEQGLTTTELVEGRCVSSFFRTFLPNDAEAVGICVAASGLVGMSTSGEAAASPSSEDFFARERWGVGWNLDAFRVQPALERLAEGLLLAEFSSVGSPPLSFYAHLESLRFGVCAVFTAGDARGGFGVRVDGVCHRDVDAAAIVALLPATLETYYGIAARMSRQQESDEEEEEEEEEKEAEEEAGGGDDDDSWNKDGGEGGVDDFDGGVDDFTGGVDDFLD